MTEQEIRDTLAQEFAHAQLEIALDNYFLLRKLVTDYPAIPETRSRTLIENARYVVIGAIELHDRICPEDSIARMEARRALELTQS